MNNILTLDVETTISNKGNPFDLTNKLVVAGFKFLGMKTWDVYLDEIGAIKCCQDFIDNADLLVGFNIKFDLHHLRRIGINFSGKKIWDTQIGEFLLESQLNPYPSLNQACEKYGFPPKLDVVKTEYWDKGIDTDKVPRDILSKYLATDLELTEAVYLEQEKQFKTDAKHLLPLFKLQNQDLLVLEEMEYNGILFDSTKARLKAEELKHEMDSIREVLVGIVGNAPINFNSNDHISAILYGGTITIDDRIPVGVFKTGLKVGQTRYKIIQKEYEFPRLTTPIKGTETKYVKVEMPGGTFYEDKDKPTHWKVNNDVLASLKLSKEAKRIVDLLNKLGELEKLCGTYLLGWSDLILKMNWPTDMIHGTLNQCTVVTGRLSSTKPNLQNADPETKTYCVSRYE